MCSASSDIQGDPFPEGPQVHQGPQVPEGHEVHQGPQVPEGPQVHQGPQVPEGHEVHQGPQVPEGPQVHQGPQVPEGHEVAEENTSTTRHGLYSCIICCLSMVTIFFSGVMMGFPGGYLLGREAVVLLRSLELLAEDKPLMDQLENSMNNIRLYDLYLSGKMNTTARSDNVHIFNVFISVLAVESGGLILSIALFLGIAVGSLMYEMLLQNFGENARAKAFSVAGPLCMVVTSVMGSLLGALLQIYLSITLTVILVFYVVSVLFLVIMFRSETYGRNNILFTILSMCAFSPLNTPVDLTPLFFFTFMFQTKLTVSFALFPKMRPIRSFVKSYGFIFINMLVILLLVLADVFNFARQPIVVLQPASTTNTSSALVEGIFIGVLSTHFLVISMGMSLFTIPHITGEFKLGVGALASGNAAIMAIESAVSLLGAGPTVGALIGVSGAVGIALTAAVAVIIRWEQEMGTNCMVGVFGVTIGAAVGSYFSSSAHSGLSALFICLSAILIPSTPILNRVIGIMLKHQVWSIIKICLHFLLAGLCGIWIYFCVPFQGVLTFIVFLIVTAVATAMLFSVSCAFDVWFFTPENQGVDDDDQSSPEDEGNQINELMNFFSMPNMDRLYSEAGNKLVHLTKGLRRRVHFTNGNRAVEPM